MLTYKELMEGEIDDYGPIVSQKPNTILQEILAEEERTDEYLESAIEEVDLDE